MWESIWRTYKLMDHENIAQDYDYARQDQRQDPLKYTLRAKLNGRLAALEQDMKQAQEDYAKAEKLGILDLNTDELHRLLGHFLR
jgi:hypothetical protein